MLSLAAALFLLFPPGLRAAEPALAPAKVEVSFPTLDECLRDRRCWGIIEKGFTMLFPMNLALVDGAMPDRFFPGTSTFADTHADAEGHFLRVSCMGPDGKYSPCLDKRDLLEKRVVIAALLKALPATDAEELYDPVTFVPTGRGEHVLAKVKKRYPDLYPRLAALVVKMLGTGATR